MTVETSPSSIAVLFPKPVMVDKLRVFVNPPRTRIGSGATQISEIRLVNETGGDVKVWFPHGAKLFDERTSVANFSDPFLIPKDASRTLYVRALPEEGRYQYHVFSEAIEDYAEGTSAPEMSCP